MSSCGLKLSPEKTRLIRFERPKDDEDGPSPFRGGVERVIAACDFRRMTTKTIEHLQNQIEELVREHVAMQRSAATAAVERAFASASAASNTRAPGRAMSRRRPLTEVAGLAEQLCAAVRANPGEQMIVFAGQLGGTPRTLNRPMLLLTAAGRVRSAGQRHLTRYFSMTLSKAA